MSLLSENIRHLIESNKLPLENEKLTQASLDKLFRGAPEVNCIPNLVIYREHRLDEKNIIDFFIPGGGIGIEVKLRWSVKEIYRQCVRYCEFMGIQELILITNKTMRLPELINGKPAFVIKPSKAWL